MAFRGFKTGIIIFVFALLFAVGLLALPGYGVPADEPINQLFGECVLDRLLGRHSAPCLIDERISKRYADHGVLHTPFWQTALVAVERVTGVSDTRSIYLLRHFLGFFLFFGCVVAFYYLTGYFLRDWRYRLAACGMLVLNPRIFADSFYNSVDLAGLSFFVFAILSMFWFLGQPTFRRLAVHSLVCGLAIGVRLPAVLVVLMTLVGMMIGDRRHLAKRVGLHFLVTGAIVILFWPYLWENPIQNFADAVWNTAGFFRPTEYLYLGKSSTSHWHYNWVWMAVTTPIAYLLLFVFGLKPVMQKKFAHATLLTWFFVPLVGAMVLRTSLYNGWRHHFFVYPAFVLIAILGLHSMFEFWRSSKSRVMRGVLLAGAILALIECADTSLFMARAHPLEYTYFNRAVGGLKGAGSLFELDYWGLSYRPALEYLAQREPQVQEIRFDTQHPQIADENLAVLPAGVRARLKRVQGQEARYWISPFPPQDPNHWEKVHTVEVDGQALMTVYVKSSLQSR